MKVNLLSANLIATWSWALPHEDSDDLCGICRVAFDGTCPTCRHPGSPCPILIGRCQHAFHMHCLLMWVQQESSRGLCPMCRQRFEWRKEENLAAQKAGMVGWMVEGHENEEGGGGQRTVAQAEQPEGDDRDENTEEQPQPGRVGNAREAQVQQQGGGRRRRGEQ